jgi:hypothetical protein
VANNYYKNKKKYSIFKAKPYSLGDSVVFFLIGLKNGANGTNGANGAREKNFDVALCLEGVHSYILLQAATLRKRFAFDGCKVSHLTFFRVRDGTSGLFPLWEC